MNGYISLCYHYIRPQRNQDSFPMILGNRIDEFRRHVELYSTNYRMLSPDEALHFSYNGFSPQGDKYGLLITFDDGLSDHYQAAIILAEKGIKALFFIPTCILIDRMPANPVIIHYCLAAYRIDGFLKKYRQALDVFNLTSDKYCVPYNSGIDNPWKTISMIKSCFKYKLHYRNAREILLHIYKQWFLKDYPDAMKVMHLTANQIEEILKMGHSIGAHSHTHISVTDSNLANEDLQKEIVEPKKYLESTFNTSVETFSYPFGETKDCFPCENLIRQIKEYKLVFTVKKILNTREISPFGLGRYMPLGIDNEITLKNNLEAIIDEGKVPTWE